jgi:ubiquinone/menaquinone biosynthesis C-methylase UbiE
MQISQSTNKTCKEREVIEYLLSLNGKDILELGCGNAELTRRIATTGHDRKIMATEVDQIQHNKNISIDDLPNVTFTLAGSEDIPADNESFDVVIIFKSLHHVPVERMADALREVKRVLRPGGMAYISEPVFDGDFNEVIRLFNDEEHVRKEAYDAIKKSIENKDFLSVHEILFNTPMEFDSFEDFEHKVINVTHTNHQLSPEVYQKVKERFSLYTKGNGARFLMPNRVNLLQKKV